MSEPTLTAELERSILAGIRAGGYPHVAAAAFGVPHARFRRWLARGRGRRALEPYRRFARAVDQAHAQARLHAEMAVLDKDPRLWLRGGPGREQPGKPGWTGFVSPRLVPQRPALDVFRSPEFLAVRDEMLEALNDFPGAHDAVSRRFDERAKRSPSRERQ